MKAFRILKQLIPEPVQTQEGHHIWMDQQYPSFGWYDCTQVQRVPITARDEAQYDPQTATNNPFTTGYPTDYQNPYENPYSPYQMVTPSYPSNQEAPAYRYYTTNTEVPTSTIRPNNTANQQRSGPLTAGGNGYTSSRDISPATNYTTAGDTRLSAFVKSAAGSVIRPPKPSTRKPR